MEHTHRFICSQKTFAHFLILYEPAQTLQQQKHREKELHKSTKTRDRVKWKKFKRWKRKRKTSCILFCLNNVLCFLTNTILILSLSLPTQMKHTQRLFSNKLLFSSFFLPQITKTTFLRSVLLNGQCVVRRWRAVVLTAYTPFLVCFLCCASRHEWKFSVFCAVYCCCYM